MTSRPCSIAALLVLAVALTPAIAAVREGAVREHAQRVDRDELVTTGGWALQSATAADGTAIAAVTAPGVLFEAVFSGDAVGIGGGCNRLHGGYRLAGKRMTITLAAATRMACEGNRADADTRLIDLLGRAFKAELVSPQPYRLRLTADNGDVIVFQAKPLPL